MVSASALIWNLHSQKYRKSAHETLCENDAEADYAAELTNLSAAMFNCALIGTVASFAIFMPIFDKLVDSATTLSKLDLAKAH